MGTTQLNERPSGFEKRADSNGTWRAKGSPKKSCSGASTDGHSCPSQYIRTTQPRSVSTRPGTVSQIRRTAPGPATSASTTLSPGWIIFQAAPLRPAWVRPPSPRRPSGFSNEYQRVSTPFGSSKIGWAGAVAAASRSEATRMRERVIATSQGLRSGPGAGSPGL